jgi:hypothetical protein
LKEKERIENLEWSLCKKLTKGKRKGAMRSQILSSKEKDHENSSTKTK